MKYVVLAAFTVAAILNLYGNFTGKKIGKITKPMLLPLLLIYYLISAQTVSVFPIIAIIMSWAGDVLLMIKGIKWFIFGGVAFMFSHLFYIISYSFFIDFSNKMIFAVIPVAIIYYIVSYRIIRSVRKGIPLSGLYFPFILYLVFNSTMNIFALMLLVTSPSLITVSIFAGAVLFFISDCILFLRNFHENKSLIPNANFIVMFTYALGELLIVSGLSLL